MRLYHRVVFLKDSDGIANSVDPDQTPLGADWSGSALFAKAYLSENLGTLRYVAAESFRYTEAITDLSLSDGLHVSLESYSLVFAVHGTWWNDENHTDSDLMSTHWA